MKMFKKIKLSNKFKFIALATVGILNLSSPYDGKAASGDTGTCCSETGSTCIIGPHRTPNSYYKASGPCN